MGLDPFGSSVGESSGSVSGLCGFAPLRETRSTIGHGFRGWVGFHGEGEFLVFGGAQGGMAARISGPQEPSYFGLPLFGGGCESLGVRH